MIAGLIETVAALPYDGKADLPELSRSLQFEIDDLFPVAEILHYLGFAEIKEGDILRRHSTEPSSTQLCRARHADTQGGLCPPSARFGAVGAAH